MWLGNVWGETRSAVVSTEVGKRFHEPIMTTNDGYEVRFLTSYK